jgi:ketosteroid isomerase-like protein
MTALLLALTLSSGVRADDHAELNEIYRQFFTAPVSVEAIGARYRADVIHVGPPGAPLLAGKRAFLETNIAPLAGAINGGQLEVSGTAHIVRRVIVGDMANDVGYLHLRLAGADGRAAEQLQKFSWVFVREGGRWQVVTDFDATTAPLDLLPDIQAEFTVR